MEGNKNDMLIVHAPQKGDYSNHNYKMTFVGIMNGPVLQIGYSRCNPLDKFNKKVGAQLAFLKAWEKPTLTIVAPIMPKRWKNYFKEFLYIYASKTYMSFYKIKVVF